MISFGSFSEELVKIAGGKVPLAKADDAIFRALMKKSPVKVKKTDLAEQYGGGYYDTINKEIGVSSRDFDVLAHEVGHAKIDQHFLGRLLENRVTRLAHSLAPLSGIGASILMAKGKKWGLLLPAALATPTLISEGLATHTGSKLLGELGATDEQKQKYKQTTRSGFGSYLVHPALGTLFAAT